MKYKLGFTLIELLVVIAILGVLISIVAVAVKDVRKSVRNAAIIIEECERYGNFKLSLIPAKCIKYFNEN